MLFIILGPRDVRLTGQQGLQPFFFSLLTLIILHFLPIFVDKFVLLSVSVTRQDPESRERKLERMKEGMKEK